MEYKENAMELITALNRLRGVRQRFMRAGNRLTVSEAAAIHVLLRQCDSEPCGDGVKISDLGAAMGISCSAASQVINRLEDRGLVERRTRRDDRRVTYVCFSQQGMSIMERERGRIIDTANRMADALGENDAAELVRLLNKLIDALENCE